MTQSIPEFFGPVSIPTIAALVTSVCNIGATNTQVTIATDNGCFNHPVATTSITFKFVSDTSAAPPTRPSSPNPVAPPTRSSSPNPAAPPTRPSSPNPSNLSDNSEISEVLVDAASETSAALAGATPANAAAPITSTTPFVPSAIVPPGMTAGATQRWYAIIVGSQVGVYQGWNNVRPFIKGISGNKFVGYATKDLAIASFTHALVDNKVTLVSV